MGRVELLTEETAKTWEDRFALAFFKCLEDGVHPGPAELNDRLGRGRKNNINGRESKLRRQLMHDNRVPYKRGYDAGNIPDAETVYRKV